MAKKFSRDYELAEMERRLEGGLIIAAIGGIVAGALASTLVWIFVASFIPSCPEETTVYTGERGQALR